MLQKAPAFSMENINPKCNMEVIVMYKILGIFLGNLIGHIAWDAIKAVSKSSKKTNPQTSETKGD